MTTASGDLRAQCALQPTSPPDFALPATSPGHCRSHIGRRPPDFMPTAARWRIGRRCVAATAESRGAPLTEAAGYMSEQASFRPLSRLPVPSTIDVPIAIDCMAVSCRSGRSLASTHLRSGLR